MHADNPSKNTIHALFKMHETRQMVSGVLSCSNTKTQSFTWIYNPETAVRLFCKAAERASFQLYIRVWLRVLGH